MGCRLCAGPKNICLSVHKVFCIVVLFLSTEVMYIHRKSSFLVGKDPRVADITLYHPTISKQHAAIQFRRRFEEIW